MSNVVADVDDVVSNVTADVDDVVSNVTADVANDVADDVVDDVVDIVSNVSTGVISNSSKDDINDMASITYDTHYSCNVYRGTETCDYTLSMSGFIKTSDCEYNTYFYMCCGNNDTTTKFLYKGYTYKVSIITESDNPIPYDFGSEFYCDIQIETNGSPSNFKEFIEETRVFYKKNIQCTNKEENTIVYYIYDDEYWNLLNRVTKRSLDTIYLPKDTKNKIYSDVKNFLSPKTKQRYQEFGIPYKRNYLFEGIPGTGKTSLVTAIGSSFDLHVSIMTFDNKTTDNIFMKSLTHLEDNSLLVLEDIDTLFHDRKKNDEFKNMISFSGILNILDGLAHKEGLITIMTTNYKERLDPALIRPGRVDMVIHFDYANKEQVLEIFNKFFPKLDANKFYKEIKKTHAKVTTSMLQQYLFGHLDDGLVFENLSELTKLARDNKFEGSHDLYT